MNSFKNILRSSLETGFIDLNFESDDTFRPKLLTNEPKAKIKVQNTIIKELRNCQEFIFSVAFLTTGGIAPLVGILKDLEEKNIKGKILVSQYLNFTQPEALRVLRQFSNIELKIATIGDFHSKGYIFKNDNHYNLIIGSSNLTLAALSKNKEWNLKVTTSFQSEIIQQTLIEFEKEFEKATSVDDEFIRKYSFLYNTQKRFTTQLEEGLNLIQKNIIEPNLMQISALENIQKLIPLNIKYSINNIELKSTKIILSNEFKQKLENIVFKESLMDAVNYSIEKYLSDFDSKKLQGGFVLYRKYSRKDVFRILDWIKNPVSLNVGGYMISDDKSNCALFVNYKKEDSISSTTKYEDQFLNHSTFQWMSKNNRTLISPDVKTIIESQTSGIRIPLFIKKSNDEGDEFYFMGDLSLKKDNYEQEEKYRLNNAKRC